MTGKSQEILPYDIAVFDFETDPFLYDRKPEPFLCGWYDGSTYLDWWADDCAAKLIEHIRSITRPTLIYAHNGGKFDFIYILHEFDGLLKIVNGRVLSGVIGQCELRDSWGIIPEPLGVAGSKMKINIKEWFERGERGKHEREIRAYCKVDCTELWELVYNFHLEFGNRLTIGGTAMRELQKHHKFERATEPLDKTFRDYYFGGRCQVIEPGLHLGEFMMVDINSAYADVMARLEHPTGTTYVEQDRITSQTDFAIVEAKNYGAFCARDAKSGSLRFDIQNGIFYTTAHEIAAAEETGTAEITRVIKAIRFLRKSTFAEFIHHFAQKKVDAELAGNKILRDFYKRVNNSSYGKFAQNPEDHCEYMITGPDDDPPTPKYIRGMTMDEASRAWRPEFPIGDHMIWSKPSGFKTYFNIATAASITGGTRATLLRGLASATRPLYCDTDSIICEAFDGEINPTKLGAWKLEKFGPNKDISRIVKVAINGKKLYACFGEDSECLKLACKGAKLTGAQILRMAETGEMITYRHEAPNFTLDGTPRFISRRLQPTGFAQQFGRIASHRNGVL